MNIEFTKNPPEVYAFRNIIIGDIFLFGEDGEAEAFIKTHDAEDDLGCAANAVQLSDGDLVYFPDEAEVFPVRHKLLIYKD